MDQTSVKMILEWLERMIQEWGIRKNVRDGRTGDMTTTEWSFGRRVEKK